METVFYLVGRDNIEVITTIILSVKEESDI